MNENDPGIYQAKMVNKFWYTAEKIYKDKRNNGRFGKGKS